MKRAFGGTALAIALLTPLGSAKADTRDWGSFCTTALSLNFCGSVQVSAVAALGGGTNVMFTVLNTSGGVSGGDYRAVFTAIGLDNIGMSNSTTFSAVTVKMNGTTYSGWQLELNKVRGGGINVDMLSDTRNGINNGISSACRPITNRVTDGGIGGCPGGSHSVTISFHISSTFALSNAQLFIKAQGFNSSTCVIGTACAPPPPPPPPPTTVPEPTTLALFGTGLLGLIGHIPRRRRRKDINRDPPAGN
jgi:MYXO-CTERM domain-containing protein